MSATRKRRGSPTQTAGPMPPAPRVAEPATAALEQYGNPPLDLGARFRLSMRLVASTVAVVTASDENHRGGMTATAVCSLCIDPPLLLVCVNRGSHTHGLIQRTGRFCLNYLADHHQEVARVFSHHLSEAEEKFAVGTWTRSALGNPVLSGSLAVIECAVHRRIDEGTHSVFMGSVVGVDARHQLAPLVYARSEFARLVDRG